PPREIQDAMEKQMKAEREKRSQILIAEGNKESMILGAEAQKQSAILHAEGVKEQKIREAQGEAESVMMVQKALADSISLLNIAAPSDRVLALKSFESLVKVADGKATKIIIPSEMQSMAGFATSLKEIMSNDAPAIE
ncbi:MAG: SPFH domain-containing protein, partial [Angelakisella sp.]